MLKGFIAQAALAVLLAVPQSLLAQVYRCETASGVIYSDMPCSESAEEIVVTGDVVDMKGVGSPTAEEPVEGAVTSDAGAQPAGEGGQDLNSFLVMLRAQREEQIAQLDDQLNRLRARATGIDFIDMEPSEQDRINQEIAQLESDRASILAEYEALIAEAERRLN